MTHDTCRQQIIDRVLESDARRHLGRCPSCRRFAEANDTLLRLAPALVPTPSNDLADRVLERVAGGPAGGVGPRRSRWDEPRMPWLPTVAAAIVLLMVIGGVVVGSDPAQTPEDVLLTAAEQTSAAGGADLEVEATAEVVVPVPASADPTGTPPPPDFAVVAPELRPDIEAEWAATMAAFDRQMEEFHAQLEAFQAQMDEALDAASRELDEQMRRMDEAFGGGAGPPPPPPPPPAPRGERPAPPAAPPARPPAPEPPPRPTSVSTGFTVRGEGAVSFARGQLELSGVVDGRAAQAPFQVSVRHGTAVYQQPDGTWVSVPGPAGPLGAVLLDPTAMGRVLRAPAGEVDHAGTAELDGEGMERYRFRVRDDAFAGTAVGALEQPMLAEAWIDGSGRLRQLTLHSDGLLDPDSGASWRTTLGVRLTAFSGGPADVELPVAAEPVPVPDPRSHMVYPFGATVEASGAAGGRAGGESG